MCCSPWSSKQLNTTERLNWTDISMNLNLLVALLKLSNIGLPDWWHVKLSGYFLSSYIYLTNNVHYLHRMIFITSCDLLLLFSHWIVSESSRPHRLQHSWPLCPSPSPEVCPSSCPWFQWCHPVISSSDTLFSFCPQSFPASAKHTSHARQLSRLSLGRATSRCGLRRGQRPDSFRLTTNEKL